MSDLPIVPYDVLINIFPKYIKNLDFINFRSCNSKFFEIELNKNTFSDEEVSIIKVMLDSAKNGDLKTLIIFDNYFVNLLKHKKKILFMELFKNASIHNNGHIMKYAIEYLKKHEKKYEWIIKNSFKSASRFGNVDILKFIISTDFMKKWITDHQIRYSYIWASKNNHFNVIKFLIEKFPQHIHINAFQVLRNFVIVFSDVNNIIWLLENGYIDENYFTETKLKRIIENSDIETIEYLYNSFDNLKQKILRDIIYFGEISFLIKFIENKTIDVFENIRIFERRLIEKGHLNMIDFLKDFSFPIDFRTHNPILKTFIFAAKKGNLNTLKYFSKNYPNILQNNSIIEKHIDVFETVAKNGYIDVLKYLVEICPELDINIFDSNLCIYISKKGDMDMLKYILEINKNIDVSDFDINVFSDVAKQGHLNILKYFVEINRNLNFDLLNENVFIHVIEKLNLDTLKYLFELKSEMNLDNVLGENNIINMISTFKDYDWKILSNNKRDEIKNNFYQVLKFLSEKDPKITINIDTNCSVSQIISALGYNKFILIMNSGLFVVKELWEKYYLIKN